MKTSYEERAKKFLMKILPYIENCKTRYQYYDAIEKYNQEHHKNVIVSCGSCRIVLITSDYVIKIDYDKANIRRFGGNWKEYCFYKKAERDGYAHLFAKVSRVKVGHHYYYIMPRVNGIGESNNEYTWSDDEWDYVDTYVDDLHEYNVGRSHRRTIIIDYACHR